MLSLKSPDELELVHVLGAIMSAGTPGFGGRQETLLYIVANGPRADLRTVTQLEDVDRFGFGDVEHDIIVTVVLSTVKYLPLSVPNRAPPLLQMIFELILGADGWDRRQRFFSANASSSLDYRNGRIVDVTES